MKTFMAMLLSGAIGASGAGAVAYTHYVPQPVFDMAAFTQNMREMKDAINTQDRSAQQFLIAMKEQHLTLIQVHQDLLRQEAAQVAIRAQAQAANDRWHGGINSTINSIPTK